jgi:hypothetical protein
VTSFYFFISSAVLTPSGIISSKMKSVLARWLLLWIRAHKLPNCSDSEILDYVLHGSNSSPAMLQKLQRGLADEHVKMLNLGHEWIDCFLPFVLQKINRVHFGLLQPRDVELLEADGVRIPTTRKLLAVPFVGKDVPSRASEFAHPDVLIGLTILAFRYEGLRQRDFGIVIRHMQDRMSDETGNYRDRPTCQRFEQWILCTGKFIRGSKKREKKRQRNTVVALPGAALPTEQSKPPKGPKGQAGAVVAVNVFQDIFNEEDDGIWPLQLVEPRDKEQNRILFALLAKLPHAVMYFLNDIIFPEMLAHQGLKLSTCGQELGGDILFGRRIGFSGTPSDIVPLELGGCQYERGSDGRVVHYLLSTSVMDTVSLPTGWNVKSLLDFIANVLFIICFVRISASIY